MNRDFCFRDCTAWSQLIIFPEGATTNGKALLTFKAGGFIPGVAVQPVMIKYPNMHDTTSWTWDQPHGALGCILYTMTQLYVRAEIHFLPRYCPSVLFCTVLSFCTVLYYTVLSFCIVLNCTVLSFCTVLYFTVLSFCTLLYFTVLYFTVLLYCTVLCCNVLYCTIQYCLGTVPPPRSRARLGCTLTT